MIGVDAQQAVEVAVGVGQCVRLRMDRDDGIGAAGFDEPLPVVARLDPEVVRDDLDAELLGQKYARDPPAAAHVQHADSGWSGTASVSHSMSHSALGPMLFPNTQSGW